MTFLQLLEQAKSLDVLIQAKEREQIANLSVLSAKEWVEFMRAWAARVPGRIFELSERVAYPSKSCVYKISIQTEGGQEVGFTKTSFKELRERVSSYIRGTIA